MLKQKLSLLIVEMSYVFSCFTQLSAKDIDYAYSDGVAETTSLEVQRFQIQPKSAVVSEPSHLISSALNQDFDPACPSNFPFCLKRIRGCCINFALYKLFYSILFCK